MTAQTFDGGPAGRLLAEGVSEGIYPAAVAEVGTRSGRLWRHAVGAIGAEADDSAASVDTIFDLASLTKVIATTTLAMQHVENGTLPLDHPIRSWLPEWRGDDRTGVTVADVLAHTSGLTAHLPFFRDHVGRVEFEPAICHLPLEYEPRTSSVYSDLGFILLGFILADVDTGSRVEERFADLGTKRGWGRLKYRPPAAWRAETAPTEHDAWRGRMLVGDVHDENCAALGGVAGHAGLFGTASAVGRFARDMLAALSGETTFARPDTVRYFCQRTTVPGSSRALGWDTMLPTSSCGTKMSRDAIGHTGFTGTSLWIDPVRDCYIVLLTNRVHPTRTNDAILAFRPAFHDAILTTLDSG